MTYATQQMQVARWVGHGSDWPEGHRQCLKCTAIKALSEFHKHAKCKGGYNSVCKACRIPASKQQNAARTMQRRLYDSAKSRSTKKGRDFGIEMEDIVIPDVCPVFGIPLTEPSIDRIDSSKGYVKGNIRVISLRANHLKNNATAAEMRLILADLERIEAGVCEIL